MSPEPAARVRVGAAAGVAGPCLFLSIAFAMAVARADVIRAQGWASWPSSMAIGGWVGSAQIAAFLILAACYPVFAWWALRPTLGRGAVAFTVLALGELFLAFPTDARGQGASWHGIMHLIGVFVVTGATAVASVQITRVAWKLPGWRSWRWVGAPSVAVGVVVGVVGGFHTGWAKVFFVLAITLPIPLLAGVVAREARSLPVG